MKRVLMIENFSSDFYKARIPLARFLISRGWDVYALIPFDEFADKIRKEGIKVIEYKLDRKNKGIRQIATLVKTYRSVIKQYDINVVHSFRFQPNLLNILANFFNSKIIILHITGLGIAFSNTTIKYLILRYLSQIIFQLKFLRADKVIVQNNDDKNDIWLKRLWAKKLVVVQGSGVDTFDFSKRKFDKEEFRHQMGFAKSDLIFICVTRLIWEKGIHEMVESFKRLRNTEKDAHLWIVGWSDLDNPRHIPESYIEKWNNEENIHFLGKRDNIIQLLSAADIFIYPSYYREGIPRGILEALSMGLPIITTDMPGCNLTVIHGVNGYLIKPKDVSEISVAVKNIVGKDLMEMGKESRMLAETMFSNEEIFSQIEKLYNIYNK